MKNNSKISSILNSDSDFWIFLRKKSNFKSDNNTAKYFKSTTYLRIHLLILSTCAQKKYCSKEILNAIKFPSDSNFSPERKLQTGWVAIRINFHLRIQTFPKIRKSGPILRSSRQAGLPGIEVACKNRVAKGANSYVTHVHAFDQSPIGR